MSGIDKQIYKAEEIDLTGADINRIIDGKALIITYEQLDKYNTINELLELYEAAVILYETKQNYGHWVCIFINNKGELEFFDSYGLYVDEELKISPEFNMRLHNGVLVPHLSALVSKSNYKFVWNKKQLQKFLPDINTCGRWVAMRLRFRDIDLNKFIDLFTKNQYYDADFWISAMSLLI
jgi:hypothetical protein